MTNKELNDRLDSGERFDDLIKEYITTSEFGVKIANMLDAEAKRANMLLLNTSGHEMCLHVVDFSTMISIHEEGIRFNGMKMYNVNMAVGCFFKLGPNSHPLYRMAKDITVVMDAKSNSCSYSTLDDVCWFVQQFYHELHKLVRMVETTVGKLDDSAGLPVNVINHMDAAVAVSLLLSRKMAALKDFDGELYDRAKDILNYLKIVTKQ